MAAVLKPRSEPDLAEIVSSLSEPVEIVGTATKRGWGRPCSAMQQLDLSGFTGIEAYEPEELILEAGAGTRLADLEAMIAQRGQYFAFEPPDFSRLLGSAHAGTLGGALCCNLSGPRRIKAGAFRDHVLGMRGVSGRGDTFKAGARVVKNVTGYDLPKLMANSFGTLAALTSVTVKVLPRPETEETVCVENLDAAAAVSVMSLALQSSCEVSGAAHVPGRGTYLRLEGFAASVASRRDSLSRLLARPVHILAETASRDLWQDLRDAGPLCAAGPRAVWRLSVTPSEAPSLMARIGGEIDLRYYLDWGGGLAWLDVPSTEDAGAALIRSAMTSGHATLMRAPDEVRAKAHPFHPQPVELAALTARVKSAFDPRRLFNPGRMYRDV